MGSDNPLMLSRMLGPRGFSDYMQNQTRRNIAETESSNERNNMLGGLALQLLEGGHAKTPQEAMDAARRMLGESVPQAEPPAATVPGGSVSGRTASEQSKPWSPGWLWRRLQPGHYIWGE
jgi:hypothetical protein